MIEHWTTHPGMQPCIRPPRSQTLFFTASPIWGAEVLARRLSISFQNTPIKQALDEVARLADFEWSYNTKILEPGRRVTFTAQDWSVREILREMLGEEYTVKSNGQYLILKRQKPPKTEVSGVIRATNSGERLANVTVYDRKTLRATTTDSSGYYHLKVKKKLGQLNLSKYIAPY